MDQEKLTKKLIDASREYYAGNAIMSDLEFDRLVDELRQMEEKSGVVLPGSPTQDVGAQVVNELVKAKHEQPALSLDKIKYKDREQLKKWLNDRQAVMMWKCDGSTVVLTYDHGRLTSAVTRGNGEEGSVITHNARYFKGVPAKIDYTEHLVVRGEAMMTNAEFERVNAEAGGIYENARNLATATIQMLDSNESRKREIIFKTFELVTPGPDMYYRACEDRLVEYGPENIDYEGAGDYNLQYMGERLNWLNLLGFDVVEWDYTSEPFGTVSEYGHTDDTESIVLTKVEEWKNRVSDLPYPTDGLVFSYNDLKEGWALGSTGHHPRWAMALKWTDETVTTTIRNIEWSVGKTGIITPVAVFDEVRMGLGSNVTRASLHNISILKKLAKLEGNAQNIPLIGSKAEVYMANMIIPQVLSVEHTPETYSVKLPYNCPVCSEATSLVWNPESNTEVLMCTNHERCPAQQIGRLENAVSRDGLNIKGLSEKKLEFLVNEGYIETVLDIYRLHDQGDERGVLKKDLSSPVLEDQPGWDIKSVDNLLNAIDESRNTTLQRFLYSLNIPLLGNDLSKKLSKFWNNDIEAFKAFVGSFTGLYEGNCMRDEAAYADGVFEAGLRTLSGIDGVGEEKARNILNWIDETTAYREKYEDFIALIDEFKFPTEKQSSTNNSLEGSTFVITGSVHEYKNRDEFKASVEARGGKVAGSVSKNTTALVNNDVTSTSGKNQKAKELGIEIISEDEFINRYGK